MLSKSEMLPRLVLLDSGFNADTPFYPQFKQIVTYKSGDQLKKTDVLMFEGGTDINPEIYGDKFGRWTQSPHMTRDSREIAAFRAARIYFRDRNK